MNAPKKLPISVCIVAGNEAHRIAATLQSVQNWTREIVVVLNSDVNDGTDKIAESFGAKVFREPWKGFIGQKNSVAEKCGETWLLNLDADEVITPELQAEITAATGQSRPAIAYEFPRCTFYCGRWIRHGDWYPDRVLRLWQRGAARWAGEEPHAYLAVTGRTGRLKSDLLHYSNESIARHVAKIVPYQAGFVQSQRAAGKTAGFLELAVRPLWRFLRAYVFRLGFLDGWQGFYIAGLNAFSSLTRYALLRESASEPKHD